MKKLGIWCSWLLMLTLLSGFLPAHALAAELEQIQIPVSVTVDGTEPDLTEIYTVELIPKEDRCPMPEAGGTIRMAGGSTDVFRIPLDQLGVFDYTVRQTAGQNVNCTYDGQLYRLRLFVTATEDGRKTASAVVYDQEGDKLPDILFQNRWADPVYLSISAIKTLDGKTPKDGAFSFLLLTEDGEPLFKEKNKGRNVSFPALRFDKVGVYRYTLLETDRTDDRVIYDMSVYTITVKVTKDTDYHAAVSYRRNDEVYTGTPSFANRTDTGIPQTGDPIGIYAALLATSAAALTGILVTKKRRK